MRSKDSFQSCHSSEGCNWCTDVDLCVLMLQRSWSMGKPCTCWSLRIRSWLRRLKSGLSFCRTIIRWCSVACMNTTPVKDRRRCVSLHAHLCQAAVLEHAVGLMSCFSFSCVAAYAFAELIDNALSATAKNTGIRRIEIRLVRIQPCFYYTNPCELSQCHWFTF